MQLFFHQLTRLPVFVHKTYFRELRPNPDPNRKKQCCDRREYTKTFLKETNTTCGMLMHKYPKPFEKDSYFSHTATFIC